MKKIDLLHLPRAISKLVLEHDTWAGRHANGETTAWSTTNNRLLMQIHLRTGCNRCLREKKHWCWSGNVCPESGAAGAPATCAEGMHSTCAHVNCRSLTRDLAFVRAALISLRCLRLRRTQDMRSFLAGCWQDFTFFRPRTARTRRHPWNLGIYDMVA